MVNPSSHDAAGLAVDVFIQNVRMELGQDRGHGIEIELSNSQIVYCLRRALAAYSRYFPIKSSQVFTVLPGQQSVRPDPPLRGELNVDLVDQTEGEILFPETGLFGGSFLYNSYGGAYDYTVPRQYYNYLEWQKISQRIFSTEPGYFFDEDSNTLYVHNPSRVIRISITGAIDRDAAFGEEERWETDPAKRDPADDRPSSPRTDRLSAALSLLPGRHRPWIIDLAKAHSKKILGEMRRTHGTIPGISGSPVTLDGGELVTEGKEEWDEVMSAIASSCGGYEPIFG